MAEFEEWVGGGFVGAGEVEEAGFFFRHCLVFLFCWGGGRMEFCLLRERGGGDCMVLFRRCFL